MNDTCKTGYLQKALEDSGIFTTSYVTQPRGHLLTILVVLICLIKERAELTVTVTKRFGVGKASVVRWSKQIEPQDIHNKPTTKIDQDIVHKLTLVILFTTNHFIMFLLYAPPFLRMINLKLFYQHHEIQQKRDIVFLLKINPFANIV